MGLLISDTMLIDPMLDTTAWWQESLGACATDAARDASEYEAADPID